MATVGVDIDGVLYPWDECARDALVAEFGIERPGPSTHWSYLKDVLTPEQWGWLWTPEGQRASFWQTERTYPGAVEMVNELTKSSKVHFVTHRDPRLAGQATTSFLTRHFSAHPWAGVHVTQNGTPKHSLARWDAFVDDKVETVVDLLTFSYGQVFAPRRPWNTELEEYAGHRRFTYYDDPAEVVEALTR